MSENINRIKLPDCSDEFEFARSFSAIPSQKFVRPNRADLEKKAKFCPDFAREKNLPNL